MRPKIIQRKNFIDKTTKVQKLAIYRYSKVIVTFQGSCLLNLEKEQNTHQKGNQKRNNAIKTCQYVHFLSLHF